jgi:L-ascorbate metabolism protein UlaG (beta-lactamase superfamily)
MTRARLALLAALALGASSCDVGAILKRNSSAFFSEPAKLQNRIKQPVRADARLAVLWVGHATALIQMDDKFVLTDPVFTETVGQFSRRIVEPGIDPADLPHVDAVVISHMHFDHLSMGSLALVERKVSTLVVPEKGTIYIPDFAFDTIELAAWQSYAQGGLRITAVPVLHPGFRWGVDTQAMDTSATGYVIEYHGMKVYFGGDTAYAKERFQATAARFPGIDLALLPISPVNPRAVMDAIHLDSRQALLAFQDLGARWMVPVHHATFVNSVDPPYYAAGLLQREMAIMGVGEERVHLMDVGEQQVFVAKAPVTMGPQAAPNPAPPAAAP